MEQKVEGYDTIMLMRGRHSVIFVGLAWKPPSGPVAPVWQAICCTQGVQLTFSRTLGEGLISTVVQRHSKRAEVLCTKRGCSTSCREPPGIHPNSAMSWHPLHTPRLKVSVLHKRTGNLSDIALNEWCCDSWAA